MKEYFKQALVVVVTIFIVNQIGPLRDAINKSYF